LAINIDFFHLQHFFSFAESKVQIVIEAIQHLERCLPYLLFQAFKKIKKAFKEYVVLALIYFFLARMLVKIKPFLI